MTVAHPDRLVGPADLEQARRRLAGLVPVTPVVAADPLGTGPLRLKAESLQPVGSFKVRGALNRMSGLSAEERERGVVAHSSGNHAQAVAWAARRLGIRAVVVMPRNAPELKRRRTEALGAEVVTVGDDSDDRERACAELVSAHGLTAVPPFDHPEVIAGQGTVGLEIVEAVPDVDLVLVPVSGGGLVSGVATAVKHLRPRCRVVGVEPELAADAKDSLGAGRIVAWPAEQVGRTIADGLRVRRLAPRTFAHVCAFVDEIVTVSEDEIRQAMRALALGSRLVAEPAGAVAAAAWFHHRDELPPSEVPVAVLSGGNVEPALLAEVLA